MSQPPTSAGAPPAAPKSVPTRRAATVLALAALLWIGAMVRTGFAVRELGRIRAADQARVARIRALDPAFRDTLTRDLAAGLLLGASHDAGPDVPGRLAAVCAALSAPRPETVSCRALSAEIDGHPLREAATQWNGLKAADFARIVRAAGEASPPIRLRRAEISARPDGVLDVSADFVTL